MSAVKDAGGVVPGQAEVMAQAGSENFPVAAFFLPGKIRRHLLNIYGFARLVDDLGDEVAGDRLAHLDWLESEVDRTYSGSPHHPLMRRLTVTVGEFAIPRQPFLDLIEANRRDQSIKRYATVEELIEYCSYSADPVGRLVLYVFSAPTRDRFELSNAICTGLQLVEHWQDVAEDYAAGRIYLPGDDMDRFGVCENELAGGHASAEFRRLMAFEVERAHEMLTAGAPLINTLRGRRRLAIAAFVAGGRAALNAIQTADFDVLSCSPRPSKGSYLLELGRTLWGLRGQ